VSTEPNQPDPQAAAEAAIRLEAWLVGRQANVHPEISTTLVRAEPYDRSSSSYTLAESDLRAVLAERNALAARVAKLEADRAKWADPVCGMYRPEAEAFTAREARAEAAALTGDETGGSGTTPRDWWRTRGACRYCGCDVHQDDPAEPVGDGVAHPICHQRAQERIAECAARQAADASEESGT
jgi:hypothetical protein